MQDVEEGRQNNFFNKRSFRKLLYRNTMRYCVYLLESPCRTELTVLSTNQRTACVAQTCQHPFTRLSIPTEEYCGTSTAQNGSVRIGSRPLLAVET